MRERDPADVRLGRVRHHDGDAEGARRVHQRELLGQVDVAGRDDRIVLAHETQDLLDRRQQAEPVVEQRDTRPGEPELPAVDGRRERRHPDHLGAGAERDLDRGGVQPADLEV